jgi:serine/threonine-protein kinase
VKPGIFSAPRLSPDGKRVLLAINTSGIYDIWAYDWERDIMTRLTFGPRNNRFALWTPDGRGVVYSSADGRGLFWIRADGTGSAQQLTTGSHGPHFADAFSPDGKRLVFSEQTATTSFDISTVDIDWSDANHPKAGKPRVFLATPSNESGAAVSPDGRWLAYHSNETGAFEVYVRPFADAATGEKGKWQVSSGGASSPRWVRGAHELIYRNREGRIMAASYTVTGDSFSAAKPRAWCEKPLLDPSTFTFPLFDLAPDGKRIIAIAPAGGAEAQPKSATHVVLLQNFFDELRRRAPVR